MSDKSKIEWTDATWNIITGCSVVSAGCKNCYAMKLAGTRLQHHQSRAGLTIDTANGPVWNGNVTFNDLWLDQPLRYKKPRKIFVCAHSDLFHDAVPDAWVDQVFAVMALSPHHTFQVLTKRPERMLDYLSNYDVGVRVGKAETALAKQSSFYKPKNGVANVHLGCRRHMPLPNVWLGVSVENQAAADERIPLLLKTPAAVHWVSAEPLLGAIDLTSISLGDGVTMNALNRPTIFAPRINGLVVGGESGSNARPMHPEWPRSLRDQCQSAGVPFLFKQWGEWAGHYHPGEGLKHVEFDGTFVDDPTRTSWSMKKVGKKNSGRLLDGELHDGYPTDILTE